MKIMNQDSFNFNEQRYFEIIVYLLDYIVEQILR